MTKMTTINITTAILFVGILLLLQSVVSFAFLLSPTTPTTFVTTAPKKNDKNNNKLFLKSKPDGMSDEEYEVKMEKATKAMTAFSNKYLKNTDTTLCKDKSVPAVVIKGLAEHKVALGTPLCPCRFYENKEAEAKDGYWNCPCVPMRERHECHCMLFLTEDNAFAGDEQHISLEEVIDSSSKLK